MTVLSGDNPEAIAHHLLDALRSGCRLTQLAEVVTNAAALRVARFNTNNDHGDWNSAHHPFTFANAVQRGLRRVSTPIQFCCEAPALWAGASMNQIEFRCLQNMYRQKQF